MSRIQLFAALAAVGLIGFVSGLTAQDDGGAPPPMPGPTEHHKLFEKYTGDFTADVKMWMVPGGEPMISKASETTTKIAGGMWYHQKFNGEFMGMQFEGHGIVGYDSMKKKYVGIWVDSFSPFIVPMEGTYDAEKKVLVWDVQSFDEAGKPQVQKHYNHYNDDGSRVFIMKTPFNENEYTKTMEITYKKKAGGSK